MNLIASALILLNQGGHITRTTLAAELKIDFNTAQAIMTELAKEKNILPAYTLFSNNKIKLCKDLQDKSIIYSLSFDSYNYDTYYLEYKYRSQYFENGCIKYFPTRVGSYVQKERPTSKVHKARIFEEIENIQDLEKVYMTRKRTGVPKRIKKSRENSIEILLKESTYTLEEGDEKRSLIDRYTKRQAEFLQSSEKKLKFSSAAKPRQIRLTNYFSNKS